MAKSEKILIPDIGGAEDVDVIEILVQPGDHIVTSAMQTTQFVAGIIPEAAILCYFGSLSENITQIVSGDAGPSGPVTYVLLGVTCLFMIAAVAWSTIVVR